jgi:hypothetical protein
MGRVAETAEGNVPPRCGAIEFAVSPIRLITDSTLPTKYAKAELSQVLSNRFPHLFGGDKTFAFGLNVSGANSCTDGLSDSGLNSFSGPLQPE